MKKKIKKGERLSYGFAEFGTEDENKRWVAKEDLIVYTNCGDFLERIKDERDDLLERICKCRTFLESDKARFPEFSASNSILLEKQLHYMEQYANILTVRMEHIELERNQRANDETPCDCREPNEVAR